MNEQELTTLALAAHKAGTPRAEFLASVAARDRSHAAMQFDRAGRLESERANPPTAEQIMVEAKRIAWTRRLGDYCRDNPNPYGDKLLGYMLAGRGMSAGMEREAASARAYADQVTEDEVVASMAEATKNLSVDREYLAGRLGVVV